jgi:hypothetical protein
VVTCNTGVIFICAVPWFADGAVGTGFFASKQGQLFCEVVEPGFYPGSHCAWPSWRYLLSFVLIWICSDGRLSLQRCEWHIPMSKGQAMSPATLRSGNLSVSTVHLHGCTAFLCSQLLLNSGLALLHPGVRWHAYIVSLESLQVMVAADLALVVCI